VQRPFDLMKFTLDDIDEWTLDKIRLSIDMKPETEKGKKYRKEHIKDEKIRLISSKDVTPKVPVCIDYYTYYPNPETKVFEVWPDRYEYDIKVHKAIKPFLQ
jgi:murein L,D-transpeptidase YcbB/YkuD